MPTTRVGRSSSRQPATSPACVPPDEVEWTMTSGGGIWSTSSAIASDEAERAKRRRGADRNRKRPASFRPQALGDLLNHRRAILARRQRTRPRLRASRRAARSPSAARAAAPLATSTARRPSLAAAAAVARAWFDWTPPAVISVSAPSATRPRRDERELAHLVPAEPERDRIVALDEETRAAAEQRAAGSASARSSVGAGTSGSDGRRASSCAQRVGGHGRVLVK